ncbi:tyrosine-protein phosphatase [Haliea atlantica]
MSSIPSASRLSEPADESWPRWQERRLVLQGTPNFRDFGGYTTSDGRRVRRGLLFRSGQLSSLTEADVAALRRLRLDVICDFRREDEQRHAPNRLPADPLPRTVSLPITPGSNEAVFASGSLDLGGRQAMFDFMVAINQDFAENQGDAFGRMFRELLEQPESRSLVHCAAGKDRTGFAAAIILLALGVPREQVMADYLLTSRYFSPPKEIERLRVKYGLEGVPDDAILPMLEVHPEYLARALRSIDDYGDFDSYLREVMGLGNAERDELRIRYLEVDTPSVSPV